MSTQKILTINPELFKFNSKKKEKTRKKKPEVNKENKFKATKIKKELLKKVKDYHKDKEIEKIKEEKKHNTIQEHPNRTSNNLFERNDFENSDFEREFNKSLSFLQDLAKKNKDKKRKKTIKNQNIEINLNLPSDLKGSTEPQYGCLKNGDKPTYRQLNKTQKNGDQNNGDQNKRRIKIVLENNVYDDDVKSEKINVSNITDNKVSNINDNKVSNINDNKVSNISDNNVSNITDNKVSNISDNNVSNTDNDNGNSNIVINIDSDIANENTSKNTEFENMLDNKLDNINILDKKSKRVNFNEEIADLLTDEALPKLKNNEESIELKNIPKIRKTTRTYKYKLGKKKDSRNVGVLIKNRETQKRIKYEVGLLKKKNIQEVKNFLREKNLIKVGTQAPNDVLRKLYEDSVLAGEVNNGNNNNLVFNYMNA
tara:strand:+ start:5669 stop:6949 length:1281 start_codon:yes stop_codon:yes gene_type:complete